MYTEFRVQRYRTFQDLELKHLSRINLFGGKNNVGKTSLLEALFIFSLPSNADLLFRVNAFRGVTGFELNTHNHPDLLETLGIDALFYDWNLTQRIHLSGHHQTYGSNTFSIRAKEKETVLALDAKVDVSPLAKESQFFLEVLDETTGERLTQLSLRGEKLEFPVEVSKFRHQTYFFNSKIQEPSQEVAKRFSKILEEGNKGFVLDALHIIEPRLKDIQILYKYGQPQVSGDLGNGKYRPIIMMGDGLVRALQLTTAFIEAQDGVVIVDEIETGFHYSVQKKLWEVLNHLSKQFNVQVFASTHSAEMIQAAHLAFQDEPDYDLSYYRLDRDEKTDAVVATYYDQEAMEGSFDLAFEVR